MTEQEAYEQLLNAQNFLQELIDEGHYEKDEIIERLEDELTM